MKYILKEGNKVRMNFSTFSMIGKNIPSLIDFVKKQGIGKIEFISDKWNPTQISPSLQGSKHDVDSIAKFVIDFDNKTYTKLINGQVDTKENNMDIGELFTDLHDLIKKNDVNKYTSVYVYRKTTQESKLIETYVRKIVRKIIKEETATTLKPDEIFVSFGSHRARDYAARALGELPQPLFSFTSGTQLYKVNQEQLAKLVNQKRIVMKQYKKLPKGDWLPTWKTT